MRLLTAILLAAGLASSGCQRKVRVKLAVKSADAGVVTSTASAR